MKSDAVTASIEGSVLVVEVHAARADDPESFYARLRELAERPAVSAFVGIDETEGPIPRQRFELIEEMSGFAAENGIERIGIVGEGVKALAIEGSADHPGLAVERFEDRSAAVEWARSA